MSHKTSAIPAGCFYSPASPTASAAPSVSFNRSRTSLSTSTSPSTFTPGPFVELNGPPPVTACPQPEAKMDLRKMMRIAAPVTAADADEAGELDATPVIRKKFFSPLERLRSTQHPSPPKTTAASRLPRRGTSDGQSPSNAAALARKRISRQLQASSSIKRRPISQADAEWFLNLPVKIRTKHFTPEEQQLLEARCESAILNAADPALLRLRRLAPMASRSPDGSPSQRSSLHMGDDVKESLRWMDHHPDLDLRLAFDEPAAQGEPAQATSAAPPLVHRSSLKGQRPSVVRRPSGRRHVRVNSKPFGGSSSYAANPTPFRPSRSRPQSRHGAEGAVMAPDADATYYQDPEARQKLRQYLASTQKFDEAVEFGFPATEGAGKDDVTPARPRSAPRKSDVSNTTFFHDDDSASLSEVGDESSVPDTDVPTTPSDNEGAFPTPHRLPNTDSFRAVKPKRSPTAGGGREMTVRMTLTRPELRADDDDLYGWQGLGRGKDDSLSLDELRPFVPEPSGLGGPFGGPDGWGELAKDEGIVRKLWKRMLPGRSTA
ncbi:MAG: hypothetical protein M1832_002031 [Thelocarpon impressellum]|nr:MAG: hypothetical protein M1832_002031 [Thelocarpon impressellum]